MKKTITYLIILIFTLPTYAHMRISDRLYYNGENLSLYSLPSPLESYFDEYKVEHPYPTKSSATFRGYKASWKIKNDKLYLKKISVRRIPQIKRRVIKTDSPYKWNLHMAEWYSGVLLCRKYEKGKSDFMTIPAIKETYYFHIRRGILMSMLKITSDGDTIGNIDLISMRPSYYYFWRASLNTIDRIDYKGKESYLETSQSELSPIFSKYGEHKEEFKYSWENMERNGAPICHWDVRNDSLFLKELYLRKEINRDSAIVDTINIEEEFSILNSHNMVYASWVNGVVRVKEGKYLEVNPRTGKQVYCVTKSIFLKIENGIIVGKYSQKGDLPWQYIRQSSVPIDPQLRLLLKKE